MKRLSLFDRLRAVVASLCGRPEKLTKVISDDGEELTSHERECLGLDQCPDCGDYGFFRGPSAGLSRNFTCANPTCGSRFNVARFDAKIIGERISSPSPLKGEK